MFNFYETIKRLISGPGKSQDALKKESDTKPPLILISNQMRLNVKEGLEPYEIEEFKKIIEDELLKQGHKPLKQFQGREWKSDQPIPVYNSKGELIEERKI